MNRKIFLFFLLFTTIILNFQCSIPMTITISPTSKKYSVIFVPGYKGSRLAQRDQNQDLLVWLNAAQSLGFSSPDLHLKERDSISEAGVLEYVKIPFLFTKNIYAPWISELQRTEGSESSFFSYDWRKDNTESTNKLIQFLRDNKQKYNLPIMLVGHSNGGLLAMSALNKEPDLISKVVFVGVPFSGGVGFLEDLMVGVSTGLNSKIASPCVVQSFESIYSFFPRSTSFDTKDVLMTENKEKIQSQFFDATFWKNYNLGPYAVGSLCGNEPIANLQKRLDKALIFKNSLDAKKDIKYPNVLVVRAENKGTIRRVLGSKMDDGWRWKILEGERVAGDGRVTNENALPPPGIPFSLYVSTAEHSELLNDPKTARAILNFIVQ
jgi:pimeloyl-ACP methyl ester carboxylesterase